jgi:TetR/AcrR family transcriptional regulator, lmrAB and yxaGH operons repressor
MITVIVNAGRRNESKGQRVASDVRQRMIEQAVVLLAKKGPGASFNEVLQASGAPRGSLYHHFPGGKAELVLAAMDAAGRRAEAVLGPLRGQPADKAAEAFIALWRAVLTRSRFQAGCAVLAVAVTSDSPELRDRAGQVFRTWRALLASILSEGGVPPERADGLAAALISVCEGAVVLSRAEGSSTPFDLAAAEQLRAVREAMIGSPPRPDG